MGYSDIYLFILPLIDRVQAPISFSVSHIAVCILLSVCDHVAAMLPLKITFVGSSRWIKWNCVNVKLRPTAVKALLNGFL